MKMSLESLEDMVLSAEEYSFAKLNVRGERSEKNNSINSLVTLSG